MDIGANIKEAMRVKKVTQMQLAAALGVKQNTVSQWVNGKNEPNCETIIKLCRFLDVTPNELLGWED